MGVQDRSKVADSQLASGGHFSSSHSAVQGRLFSTSGVGGWCGPAGRTSGKLFNAVKFKKMFYCILLNNVCFSSKTKKKKLNINSV